MTDETTIDTTRSVTLDNGSIVYSESGIKQTFVVIVATPEKKFYTLFVVTWDEVNAGLAAKKYGHIIFMQPLLNMLQVALENRLQ